ncbi:BTAD domain-containing putative transcriptional regulator [Streptomyces asoensis]|uniref:BTAD domain-containing putative transcriptional regulator n=1 Tax=Streptomyces asoensis TaxID=249586 RepID=UPI003410EB43
MTARRGSEPVHLGPPRHRAVLGLLMLRLGQVVRVDQLVDELWGDKPPRRPHATLQTYMSHLRRALTSGHGKDAGVAPLHYRAPGYVLALDPQAIDVCRFDEMVSRGQQHAAEGRFGEAREVLDSALHLWRADPFLDLTSYEPLAEESARLQHLRTAAVTIRAEALLALGDARTTVESLRREVIRFPSDERIVAALMTGLYRLGQQTEALRLYERTRTQLSEELGVAPGDDLRRVHLAILRHELGGAAPAGQRAEVRARPDREPRSEESRPPADAVHGRAADPATTGTGPGGHTGARPVDDAAGSGRTPAHASPLPLFEGREHALASLRRSITAALEGSGHLTAVVGQAGVGKTELLAQATAHAAGWVAGTRVVRVSCRTAEGMPACWVWQQALRMLGGPDALPGDNAPRLCPDPTVTTLSDSPEGADADRREQTQQRFLAHDALSETILRHADDAPLLLVLENVHLADRPTLDVLALLSDGTQGRAVSVVISVRESGVGAGAEPDGALQELLADSRTDVVHLDDLSEEQVQTLLAAQGGPGPATPVVRGLYERSGGNPYLLGQLLAHAGGARSLHAARAARQVLTEIPTGVSSMLRRRLAGLAPEVLRVLRGCAVLGTEADLTLLTTVLGDTTPGVRAVEEALRTGLLRRDHDHARTLVFRYGLVRDVLLAEMSDQERSDLHAWAVDVLGRQADGHPAAASRLAHHAWQASLTLPPDQVLPYLVRAGEQAALESRYDRAQTWFRRAHALLTSGPSASGAAAQALQLRKRILQIATVTRGYGDREVVAESQRVLSMSPAAVQEPALVFSQCIAQLVTGHREESARRAHQLRVMAQNGDAPEARLHERLAHGILHLPDRTAEALAALTEAEQTAGNLSAARLRQLAHHTQHDPRFLAMNHRTLALSLLGAQDDALALAQELLALTGCEGTPVDRASAHYSHALVAALAEDADATASSAAEGLRIADAHGLLHWAALLKVCRGWAQHRLGTPGALDALKAAVTDLSVRHLRIRLPLHLGLLAHAQYDAGAVEAARATLRRAAREIRAAGEDAYLSPDLPFNRLPRLQPPLPPRGCSDPTEHLAGLPRRSGH